MNDRFQFFFGLDYYCLQLPLGYFLNVCKRHQLTVYHCSQTRKGLFFYAPIIQQKRFKSVFPEIEHLKTVGCVGFLFRQMRQPFRIFLLFWCAFLYQMLSHTIFSIDYQSTRPAVTEKIEQFLQEEGYAVPFLVWNDDFEYQLKEKIRSAFQTEIAWIEVTRDASRLHIAFNDKRYGEISTPSTEPLIATKDAMIVRFDVTQGEKLVKLNQIVSRGDVLVDHLLIDAYGEVHSIFVEGKVWGKTWTTVTSSLTISEDLPFLEPFHFLRLLMDCRRQIEPEISEGEQILSENILQFTREGSTITMKVHYTCLEDITRP